MTSWVRRRTMDAIANFGPLAKEALPALVKALQDPSKWIRAKAIQTLAKGVEITRFKGLGEISPAVISGSNDLSF